MASNYSWNKVIATFSYVRAAVWEEGERRERRNKSVVVVVVVVWGVCVMN